MKISKLTLSLTLGLLTSNFFIGAVPTLFSSSDQVKNLMEQLNTASALVSDNTKFKGDIYNGNIYYQETPVGDTSLISKASDKYPNLEDPGQPAYDALKWDPMIREIWSFVKNNASDSKVLQAAWTECIRMNRLIRGIVADANDMAKNGLTTEKKNNYFRLVEKTIKTQIYPQAKKVISDVNNTRFYLGGTKSARDLILKLHERLMATLNRIIDNYNFHEKKANESAAKRVPAVGPRAHAQRELNPFQKELQKRVEPLKEEEQKRGAAAGQLPKAKKPLPAVPE